MTLKFRDTSGMVLKLCGYGSSEVRYVKMFLQFTNQHFQCDYELVAAGLRIFIFEGCILLRLLVIIFGDAVNRNSMFPECFITISYPLHV
jgi:hypothetical protein